MKMVMMIVDAEHAVDIERLFDECDVPGYTKISDIHGKGSTGKKSGNRAFPGASNLYFTALEEHCVQPLHDRLEALRDARPEEGLKAFIMETQELI